MHYFIDGYLLMALMNSTLDFVPRILSRRNSMLSMEGHGSQNFAKDPYALEYFIRQQQVFLAGSRTIDIYGREDAFFGKVAIKIDFHIACSLELFEDHLIHARSRVNERRSDDGQAPAALDISRSPKKRFGRCNALASRPPESTRPDEGVTAL